MNFVTLVGRIAETPHKENNNWVIAKLAIVRPFKNSEGMYDTDFIPVRLYNYIGTATLEYCRLGDIIGVKGRIESNNDKLIIIADKVTFLSTNPTNTTPQEYQGEYTDYYQDTTPQTNPLEEGEI